MKKYLLFLFVIGISNVGYSQSKSKIILDTITVKKYGQTFKNGVVLDFVYQFIYPNNNTPEITSIRNQIIQEFFLCDLMSLDQAQKYYQKSIYNDYATQNPNTTHQYSESYSAIKINNDKVLVFIQQDYMYFGGNHGLEPTSYSNYDLQTGKKITLEDLFSKSNEAKMLDLIKDEAFRKHGNDAKEKATLTDNFMLLPKGIMFSYKQNEIGCYADGNITVILPLSRFKHLLKPNAISYFTK